jgi:hypothetical protein
MLKRQPVVPLRLADLVDDVTWWRVPGQPQAVLSWEKAHLPGRFARSGSGTVGVPPVTWSDEFTLPPVTGVLDWRELAVEAAAAGGGRTDLRVDAEVTWLPAKPAAERVPPEATAVTISAVPGFMVGAKVPAPVTITDPAKVSRIASLVNGLSLIRPGGFNCPMDRGRAVRLTFRASAEGPALAIVSAGLTGCEGVTFTAGGTRQPMLAGGAALARQVLTIAGLSWTGYGTGSPVPGGVMMPG